MCSYGCSRRALIRTASGTLACGDFTKCPAYRANLSERVKKQWRDNVWIERRQQVSDIARNLSPDKRARWIERSRAVKLSRLLTDDNPKDRRAYNRRVHALSQHTYRQHASLINPNDLEIGRRLFHLDHKVSKHIGWILSIPSEHLASHHNLQVIHSEDNIRKAVKCAIHPLDLLVMCSASTVIIEQVAERLLQLGDSVEQLLPKRTL